MVLPSQGKEWMHRRAHHGHEFTDDRLRGKWRHERYYWAKEAALWGSNKEVQRAPRSGNPSHVRAGAGVCDSACAEEMERRKT